MRFFRAVQIPKMHLSEVMLKCQQVDAVTFERILVRNFRTFSYEILVNAKLVTLVQFLNVHPGKAAKAAKGVIPPPPTICLL